ncbi:MAG: dispase autolysis-inducing protein [Acidobacteriota bacterium]
MKVLVPSLLVLIVAVTSPAAASPRRRAVLPVAFPPCSVITGSPAVTFTHDEGRTLAMPLEKLSGIGYTYGVAALDSMTLLSWHQSTLSVSTDAGCSWRPLAVLAADFPPTIAASHGRAFAWSDNRRFLVRYDARGVAILKAPGSIGGLAIDASNPDRLRVGTNEDGVIWESKNAGDSWDPVGRLTGDPTLIYRFAFNPANLDHIVAGLAVWGAMVSRDGGRSWVSSFSSRANVFSIVFSPADPAWVWAMGLDLDASSGDPFQAKHIYLSTDGGTSFRSVVDAGPTVTLVNGALLAAHPTNRNVLYFVFGTYFQRYGTDLFRYDEGTRGLTVKHNDYDDINAIAFSPADPGLMYLGLEVESGVH